MIRCINHTGQVQGIDTSEGWILVNPQSEIEIEEAKIQSFELERIKKIFQISEHNQVQSGNLRFGKSEKKKSEGGAE